MNELTVIDFFCGAGGFSEGFRQMGFKILHGYDYWRPAVDTFNYNFNLNCNPKNMLDFRESIDEIYTIPNTEVIIGSPPCVSFSSSNNSGKADKSLGVELTEIFLRIIAVKKHQPGSVLKAWFMENVVNSRRYLQPSYTFKDLNLRDWAIEHRISPNKIAIDLLENSVIINSADYGSLQMRKRVISGELIRKSKLVIPPVTHAMPSSKKNLPFYNSIRNLQKEFPNPFSLKRKELVKDIQYPIEIKQDFITDHFYDTGIYQSEWKFSRFWKTNHPYMGRMSFPENIDKPSRTITATKIATSRESIIYKAEIDRIGDGEYRLPTVREAAIIMGFPITFQFIGSENAKWRLVGNAVCCAVSRAFAKIVLVEMGMEENPELILNKSFQIDKIPNLNTYSLKKFNNPPIKKEGARCRWHPFKDGNITVTLSNYNIEKSTKSEGKWNTSIQYGNGEGFPTQSVPDNYYKDLEPIIRKIPGGEKFIKIINNGFSEKIASSKKIQRLFEIQQPDGLYLPPNELIDELFNIISKLNISDVFEQTETIIFKNKKVVPVKQLFALYAINKICTTTNEK